MTFRLAAVLIFLAIVGPGLYYRIRAARSSEKISRREEGTPIMVLLRIAGFSAWIGLLLYLINPDWMAWFALPLPAWARWFGALLAASAIPLMYWMFSTLGENVTDTVAIRREHRLVTAGPYRWVRHPMYSATFLVLPGFALLTANWFIGVAGLIALVLIVLRTPIEETKLIERFGSEYEEYMMRTGRYLPRPRRRLA